ncbi:MAG: ABC transporter permease [Dehalococcoidia bacterium]|nr:ABC transporter permease [Dehalococcoidia bacterium]
MRHIKVSLRTPIWLFVNLVQPLVWLLLFSRVFERMVDLPGFTSDSYLQFFAPGVIIMTVLFGSAWTGMNMIQDMDLGILDKMLATPVTRVSIVLGQVFGSVSTLVVQALLIFLIAWIMGVDIATGFPGVLLTVVIVTMLGLGFAGFSNGLAIVMKPPDPLIAFISFITMPLKFLSYAMVPSDLLPGWIQVAKTFNPVSHSVESVRSLVIVGYEWNVIIPDLLILGGIATLMVLWATFMFRFRTI